MDCRTELQKNLVQNQLGNPLITKPVVIIKIAGYDLPCLWQLAYQRLGIMPIKISRQIKLAPLLFEAGSTKQ